MTVFVAREAIAVESVDAICRELGLTLEHREPWTNGVVYLQWRGEEDGSVTLANDARSGGQLLHLEPPEEQAFEAAFSEKLKLASCDAVLDAVKTSADGIKRVRALYRAHVLRLAGGEAEAALVSVQCELLLDEHAWVRHAASRMLAHRTEQTVADALRVAAEQHAHLSDVAERVATQCAAAATGVLEDTPTESWLELVERAREGLTAGQPQRAAVAMDALLVDCSDHTEGLLLRARAYMQDGKPTLATALLGAAEASGKTERDAREGQALNAVENLLDEIRAALAGLVGKPPEDGDVSDEVKPWLLRWARDGRDTAACGAAMAVASCKTVPQLDGALAFIIGRYRHDRRMLKRAHAAAPRSPRCMRALGNALATDAPDEAVALFQDALAVASTKARTGEEPDASEVSSASANGSAPEDGSMGLTADEALIEALAEGFDGAQAIAPKTVQAALLEDLTALFYDERRWDEAIDAADRLVALVPTSATAWQWRANARTFAERHEEAVTAYEEALAALDESQDAAVGSDPRPGMRFNLAGVLAHLGRTDEALDQLRRAVRDEAKWGREAKSDELFESLWDNPLFERIATGEADALVRDEEREPEHIEGLVNRAMGCCLSGDYAAAIEAASQATLLSEQAELRALSARAASVHARALAMSGEADRGVAKAVKARALADHDEVDPRVRSEVAHELGVTLHAAGNHERAKDAYELALEQRREVYGEGHPIVARSLGDLARLASDRGEPDLSLTEQGIALLDRYLAGASTGDTIDEAMLDRAIMLTNLAEGHRKADDVTAALDAMQIAVKAIVELGAREIPMGQPFVDHALNLCDKLVRASRDDSRERARRIQGELEQMLVTGTPEDQRERAFWQRLRRFVRNTARGGVPEAQLARTLNEALRGGKKLPKEMRRIPEIASFAKELASRAQRYPTVLAMAVIALSTAEANGNLDEALESLQELCVAALHE